MSDWNAAIEAAAEVCNQLATNGTFRPGLEVMSALYCSENILALRKEEDQRGAADAVRANMPGNKADSTELQPAPHQRAEAFTADCEGYGYMPPNFTDAEKAAAFEWLRSVDNRHAAVALCEWHRLKTAEAGPERVSVPRATLERWLPTIEAGADCNRSNDDAELRALLAAGSVK